MPSRTKAGLNLADKNSYVRVEENINDNILKIDDDIDATWGGLYGGYIQDETITKEVGKRYIDKFNKRAYICIKPSNVNTEDAYTECNVVNILDILQNLIDIKFRDYKVQNICFEYFTAVGPSDKYNIKLKNTFKEIIFVGFNGLTNEDQVSPAYSQQWLWTSYSEIARTSIVSLRKMSTQSIEGVVIGIV